MKRAAGRVAVFVAILSLAPSFVPGAVSVMGLLASLGALVISIFSVNGDSKYHFYITLTIVVLGIFFINDALRVWEPLPMPINAKVTMYGISCSVVMVCTYFANKLSHS